MMRTISKVYNLEGGLKALAEPNRLIILTLLARYGDLCVSQLVEALDLSQAAVSQQLRILKYHDIIKVSRIGPWSYYSINPERIDSIANKIDSIHKGQYDIPEKVCKIIECSKIQHPKNPNLQNQETINFLS